MSLSFDFSGLLHNAATFVNGLFPVYSLPLGISLAMGILGVLVASFTGIFHK
jgi:hypothetical protein